MHKYMVFIESNTTGTGPDFLQAAWNRGFTPVLMAADPTMYEPWGKPWTHPAHTESLAFLLQAIKSLDTHGKVVGILTSSDYYTQTAALLAKELGLAGPAPPALSVARNKARQRKTLADSGIAQPRSYKCLDVAEALRNVSTTLRQKAA